MKKLFLILTLVLSNVIVSVNAAERINLQKYVDVYRAEKVNEEKKTEVISTSTMTIRPLQSAPVLESSVNRKSVLLNEDFSGIPEGNTETIPNIGERYTDFLASHYYDPGRYINNEFTPQSGTWEGDWVYSGKNGTVILQSYGPYMPAMINTPLGDYSGDITVTVCARFAKTFWASDSQIGYETSTGTSLSMGVYVDGYDNFGKANTDITNSALGSGRIYEADGWQEITFSFHNESANEDGYLCFFTYDAIEIDWIKITDDNTYLASPVIKELTNFTSDGFTINWDPVRRSFNYYIDLYKAIYSSDKGIDETWGFDNGTFSEWLSAAQGDFVEGEGFNGSTAWHFSLDGDAGALTAETPSQNIEEFTILVKFMLNEPDTEITLNYDVYDKDGWKPYGYLKCDGVQIQTGGYYKIVLNGESFANKYSKIRISSEGTTENNGIFIDDVYLYSKRPYTLERVYNDFSAMYDPTNDDYAYNFYTTTGCGTGCDPQDPGLRGTSYTFIGLEPESEYWYRVRSHNGKDFTIGEKHHAFGVAAPKLLPASDVTNDSYTANWIDAPKAQKYIINNYMCEKVEDPSSQYPFMSEYFSKCSGMSALAGLKALENSDECYLDQYTDIKGWRGKNNSIGKNMIGCSDYSGGYIISPVMMANPDRGSIYVYIEVLGKPDDSIYVKCLKSGASGVFAFDENGYMSGWYEIPAVEGEQVKFQSYNGLAFAVRGFEMVQAVEKGDIIRLFDSEVEVPAGVGHYTFANLNDGVYAYSVISIFTLEKETVYSTSDEVIYTTGESNGIELIGNDTLDADVKEIARYATNGQQVTKAYKGIVLIKMSDGSVRKEYVK